MLAAKLSSAIDGDDVLCFGACEDRSVRGAIFFTRLHFGDDALIYMLAPVAVAPAHQGVGIGTALIRFGLHALARRNALVAVTSGDPVYYGRSGFEPLSESVLKAPLDLSMPFGWLGQSLTGEPIQPRNERPRCVEAFNDPAYR